MNYNEIPRGEDKNIQVEKVEFPVRYDLLSPVEVDGTNLDRLTLREPTVSDLEICDKETGSLAQSIRLLTLISEDPLSPEAVRRLGTRDFSRLSILVAAFL